MIFCVRALLLLRVCCAALILTQGTMMLSAPETENRNGTSPNLSASKRPARLHPYLLPLVHALLRACSAAPACMLRCSRARLGHEGAPYPCVLTMQIPCTLGFIPPVLCCSCMLFWSWGTHHMHRGTQFMHGSTRMYAALLPRAFVGHEGALCLFVLAMDAANLSFSPVLGTSPSSSPSLP